MEANAMKLILILVFLFPFFVAAQITGKVVDITDGDTFKLLKKDSTQIKVRFHGIDCPESKQPFSNVCKKYLSDLIFGKQVFLKNMSLDRYGRTLAIVFLDTINVNENMLSAGMAWHFKKYDKNLKWSELENKARIERIGLWKDDNPIPPWEWRKK
jgi:endonuclease YncB( thermonuclease family)